MCQASCRFAAVEVDAKNVTGSVVAWNNRTSSAYSDVSDQVFFLATLLVTFFASASTAAK